MSNKKDIKITQYVKNVAREVADVPASLMRGLESSTEHTDKMARSVGRQVKEAVQSLAGKKGSAPDISEPSWREKDNTYHPARFTPGEKRK